MDRIPRYTPSGCGIGVEVFPYTIEEVTVPKADLILLDEKESREVARDMRLKMLGTVGVLIRAKKKSLISNLRNQLDNLKQKANFRIGEDVYQRALSEVGET